MRTKQTIYRNDQTNLDLPSLVFAESHQRLDFVEVKGDGYRSTRDLLNIPVVSRYKCLSGTVTHDLSEEYI